jgi:hypothetical protein
VLKNAGIVHGVHLGRESLFRLAPKPIAEIQEYLDRLSKQWDQALARLKLFVEE